LNALTDVRDRLLSLSQLFEVHLALDITFHIGNVTLRSAEEGTDGSRDNGEPLWTKNHKAHTGDQGEFGKAKVKHV
jgi:hypothetical protein